MNKVIINKNPDIDKVFNNYSEEVRMKLLYLRKLILDVANNSEEISEEISEIEETIKWGEPSYLVKNGSTIRIDWKEKSPDQYAAYFKCTSKLVPSFKNVFGNLFKYEGNRAILFKLDDVVPKEEFKKCILAALTYHKVKHLHNIGL